MTWSITLCIYLPSIHPPIYLINYLPTYYPPICLFFAFVITLGEIFLKYLKNILGFFFNSYYFSKVHVKNLAKKFIFKKIEFHLQVLLLLKNKHYDKRHAR
jgi:hypothetical protein